MQEIDLTALLYFVSKIPDGLVQIGYSSNRVYKLTFNNVQIGLAVNFAEIFSGSVGYIGILYQGRNNRCFALLVGSSDEIHPLQISNPWKYISSKSSFLFGRLIKLEAKHVSLSPASAPLQTPTPVGYSRWWCCDRG